MMQIVNFSVCHPDWFCAFAVAWSVFQGCAGYRYGLYIFDNALSVGDGKDACRHGGIVVDSLPGTKRPVRSKWVRLLAYGLHHGVFYFVCSLSGFAAWWFIGSGIAGGKEAVLVALGVLAVSGISGALPRILYLGNRPV